MIPSEIGICYLDSLKQTISYLDIGVSQHCRNVATTTLRAMTILSQQYDGGNGNNDGNL